MLNKLMISCREASRLISEKLDRKLSLNERVMLKMHVTMCSVCKHVQYQLEALRKVISSKAQSQETTSSSEGPPLSESSKEHMKSLLREKNS